MAKIYSNENFYLPVIKMLRQKGHDVLTSLEAGNANKKVPDEEVLAFAISRKRILLTLNRKHFIRFHLQNPQHSGIIVCTEDSDFEALANRIHQILEDVGEALENQLIRINRPNPSLQKH